MGAAYNEAIKPKAKIMWSRFEALCIREKRDSGRVRPPIATTVVNMVKTRNKARVIFMYHVQIRRYDSKHRGGSWLSN